MAEAGSSLMVTGHLFLCVNNTIDGLIFHQLCISRDDPDAMRTISNDYSHYKPINSTEREVRVLVLHPAASPESTVNCFLVRSSLLTDEPCYEAISYCWGSLDDTRALRVRHLEDSVRLCGKELRDASGQVRASADDQEEYALPGHDAQSDDDHNSSSLKLLFNFGGGFA